MRDDTPVIYRIVVGGVLPAQWSNWFDGMAISNATGLTTLEGMVIDQAVLYGLLDRARDLGLPLLSVTRVAAVGAEDRSQEPEARSLPDAT